MIKRYSVPFVRILACIFSFLVLANTTVVCVMAADSAVTYAGRTEAFIFEADGDHAPGDLFTNLKSVMPGDVLTQRITVKNAESNGVKVRIYLRSKGATPETEEFLSQMKLTVKAENGSELFSAAADETAGLTQWQELGLIYSGGEVDLDLTLEVPIEMDNRFQNAVGKIIWEFKAEEFEVEPEDPKPEPPKPMAPTTGDNSNLLLWSALFLISSMGCFSMKRKICKTI